MSNPESLRPTPPDAHESSSQMKSGQKENEERDSQVLFLRCNEFMEDVISPTKELFFVDEEQKVIDGIIHAWPLTAKMLPHFIQEEKVRFPKRNYYQVEPSSGWFVYALNWSQLDSYLTYVGTFFATSMLIKPSLEEFDPEQHLGSLEPSDEQTFEVNVPYQVVLSPRKIEYFE